MSLKDQLDQMPDYYETITSDDAETISLDLSQYEYNKLVELAGSDDELEISNVFNKILSLHIEKLKEDAKNHIDEEEQPISQCGWFYEPIYL